MLSESVVRLSQPSFSGLSVSVAAAVAVHGPSQEFGPAIVPNWSSGSSSRVTTRVDRELTHPRRHGRIAVAGLKMNARSFDRSVAVHVARHDRRERHARLRAPGERDREEIAHARVEIDVHRVLAAERAARPLDVASDCPPSCRRTRASARGDRSRRSSPSIAC